MKYLFAGIAVVLVAASLAIHASFPDVRSEVPVIYWVTDNNPARQQQVALFHQWLIENELGEAVTVSTPDEAAALQRRRLTPALVESMRTTQPDARRLWDADGEPLDVDPATLPLRVRIPLAELRTDNANRDQTKQVIQGVSGVGGDIIDTGGHVLPYFQALGILEDVTEWGRELGFDVSQTYEAIRPDITITDYAAGGEPRQYAFPCNVSVQMLWVNKATFERLGVPLPPERWTVEEFESIGRQFVQAANELGERQRVFFCMSINQQQLHRSMGLSVFNETLTRSTLDDPRYARTLALLYKWTYEDRLLPSAADRASFDTASGYGGPTLQLFNSGELGMFAMGRYALIQLRKFGELDLAVVEPPHAGFPNTPTGTRCATIYVGGHPELAKYFLAYLASESYNRQIVDDADALPPNPRYTELEEFKRPEAHPNEWGVHEVFAGAMEEIAIPTSQSPFALQSTVARHLQEAEAAVMADRLTPEDAANLAHERITSEIERTLREQPGLREMHATLAAQQKQIDELRAAGKPVPLDLIANPFHRQYYREMGWAAEEQTREAADGEDR